MPTIYKFKIFSQVLKSDKVDNSTIFGVIIKYGILNGK
ncbi:hypothetical protein MCERE19_03810 [Spirosomataceae bacterium]